jgi:hypothetical protein
VLQDTAGQITGAQVKRRAGIEVLVVWSAIFLIVHTSHLNPLVRWSFRFSNWNYFSHVVYVVLPVAVVFLSGRRLRDYGLTLRNWRSGLAWGGGIAAAGCPVPAQPRVFEERSKGGGYDDVLRGRDHLHKPQHLPQKSQVAASL